jgi:apolipoprotein N-acyltransferase
MFKKVPLIVFPVLTSVLLVLAYPKFDMGWLAWGALAPLAYYLLKVRTFKAAALGGLGCGFLFYLGILYWIYPTMRAGGVGPAVSALGLALLALVLAAEFLAVSVFGYRLRKAGLKAWPYVFALGWFAMEYGKIYLSQKAVWFPWFMLGYTQADWLPLVQVVSVTGIYGLSAAVCFTGALAGAAKHVTSIDSSAPALQQAAANVALNGFDAARATFMDADVNASLRKFVAEGRQFDAIVLDPPKLAPTVAHAERAARAYKDINRQAFKLLTPGGVLFTFSCSGGIGVELFHKIVASAGLDAGVDGAILQRLGGASDHPMTINFPEGEYLKGLVVMKKQ